MNSLIFVLIGDVFLIATVYIKTMPSKTIVTSEMDGQDYIVSTRGTAPVTVAVRRRTQTKYVARDKYVNLPRDIQDRLQNPFTTALIQIVATRGTGLLRVTVQGLLRSDRVHLNTQGEVGMTALMMAVRYAPHILPLLRGADAGLVDRQGRTALMWAASVGHLTEFLSHFDSGLGLNMRDVDGMTVLAQATHRGDVHDVDVLSRIPGIDPTLVNKEGYSVATYFEDRFNKPPFESIREWHPPAVVKILVSLAGIPGIYSGSAPLEETLLMRAIKLKNVELLGAVLRLPHLDVNRQNHYGVTALMLACLTGRVAVVEALVRLPGILPNLIEQGGRTALMLAAEKSTDEAVIAALQTLPGIDPNIRDRQGNTALSYQSQKGGSLAPFVLFPTIDWESHLDWQGWIASSHTDAIPWEHVSVLQRYLQAHIQESPPGAIGRYYGSHLLEQKLLNEVDHMSRHILSGPLLTPSEDPMLSPTALAIRNAAIHDRILVLRRDRATAHPRVPEINTLLESSNPGDGMRTVLMQCMDRLLQMTGRMETVGLQIDKLRVLLDVFPAKYTNIYTQDTNTENLVGRFQQLHWVGDFEGIGPGPQRMASVIRDYISISTTFHTPTIRDCTIAPMFGMVPCRNSRYTSSDTEIRIWVSGGVACCLSCKDAFTLRTALQYRATDGEFCTLLRDRDGLAADAPIDMILPNWWGDSAQTRNAFFGVKPVLGYPLYQLVRLQ